MRPILLVQLPVPYAAPQEVTGNLALGGASLLLHARAKLPSAAAHIGLLEGRLATHGSDATLLAAILDHHPGVVGFTCTVWNVERTLALARRIRQAAPHVRIWLGGPEVALDEPFMTRPDAPYDVAVPGEGEGAFALLASGTPPEAVAGLLTPSGPTTGAIVPPALRSLATVADPLESGLVSLEEDGVAFSEWGRGCRHRCLFCRYHGGREAGLLQRPRRLVARFLSWARRSGVAEIYLLDPSLEQRKDLTGFLSFLEGENRNPTLPIMGELRAEAVSPDLARRLYGAGVRRLETGLQTLTRAAQHAIRRPVNPRRFVEGVRALRDAGIEVKLDLMLGLPGDGPEGLAETLRFVRDEGLTQPIQVFLTQVLPGTELRARAHELGLVYDPRPPYGVMATPTWPADELAAAFPVVEEALGTTFGLEDEPVLPDPSPGPSYRRLLREDPALPWAWTLDLDAPQDLALLARESFRVAASAVTLLARSRRTVPDGRPLVTALNRLLGENPFITLALVLDLRPGAALDILDDADAALDRDRPSGYAEGIYRPMTARPRPLRRLHVLVDDEGGPPPPDDWLDDVRQQARVIRRRSCDGPEGVASTLEDWTPVDDDLLLLDPGPIPDGVEDLLFRAILATAEAGSVILPGRSRALAWRRRLAHAGSWDW